AKRKKGIVCCIVEESKRWEFSIQKMYTSLLPQYPKNFRGQCRLEAEVKWICTLAKKNTGMSEISSCLFAAI
ncbi:hypothetical protein HAX54_042850, partial [Datura stramonium]|nr:hypothetical protein [Datura stramonium]